MAVEKENLEIIKMLLSHENIDINQQFIFKKIFFYLCDFSLNFLIQFQLLIFLIQFLIYIISYNSKLNVFIQLWPFYFMKFQLFLLIQLPFKYYHKIPKYNIFHYVWNYIL